MSESVSTQEIGCLIAEFLNCKIDIANLYLNILQEPKTKDTLLNNNSTLRQELENNLEVLASYRLIADYSGRDKYQTYFVVDPQFSFSAIVLSEMWEVDADLHTIGDLIKRQEMKELNARYIQCQTIIKNIKYLYKKQLPFLKEMAVVITGNKRIASYLSELLETAKTNIYAVISPPHLLGEIVWQTVIEKMNQGVLYQRITTFDELVRHGYKIFENEIHNYNETLYICKNSALSDKFYVINDITVVFFIPDRKSNDFKFEVQVIRNEAFSKRYKNVYEKLRSESLNLVELIEKISVYREKFLQNASRFLTVSESEWLTNVFDYGVFCKHQKYPSEIFESARTKCLREGIITINEKKEILAKYSFQGVLDYAL